ncbi:hypothetical protein IAD21_04804 [Abditibacteriota bacterium]|nr:hypothetical protein IAD21_04804 [Abditibacteriota bacterium]
MPIHLSSSLARGHALLHRRDIGLPITPFPARFTPTVEGVKTLNSQYSILETPLLSVNPHKTSAFSPKSAQIINLSRSFCAPYSRINHAGD